MQANGKINLGDFIQINLIIMKIVFLDASTIGNVPNMDEIRSLGDYIEYPFTLQQERIQRIGDAQVVIVNKVIIDREVMSACPNLRLVCVAATGTNNIDLVFASERNIAVKNVAGYSTNSVAQVTFSLVLELLTRTHYNNAYIQNGGYSSSNIFTHFGRPFWELAGKQYGIIGLGNIGKRVAAIAKAFGANVCYYDILINSQEKQYTFLNLNELLQTSDVISIHAPLNDFTHNLLGMPQLKTMKPSAILVNVARGGIVDEAALAEAIDSDIIAGAGFDVFTQEPLLPDHPFLTVRNKEKLLLLPHIAWASFEARTLLISRIAENIKKFS